MNKYRADFKVIKIDTNDKWRTLYKKKIGVYKGNNINEIVNKVSKKYPDSDEIEILEDIGTIFIATIELPDLMLIENVIEVTEIK